MPWQTKSRNSSYRPVSSSYSANSIRPKRASRTWPPQTNSSTPSSRPTRVMKKTKKKARISIRRRSLARKTPLRPPAWASWTTRHCRPRTRRLSQRCRRCYTCQHVSWPPRACPTRAWPGPRTAIPGKLSRYSARQSSWISVTWTPTSVPDSFSKKSRCSPRLELNILRPKRSIRLTRSKTSLRNVSNKSNATGARTTTRS